MEEQDYLAMLQEPEFSPTLASFSNVIGQLKDADVIMNLNTSTVHKYNLLVQLVKDMEENFKQIHVAPISTISTSTDKEEMLEELYGCITETIAVLESIIA